MSGRPCRWGGDIRKGQQWALWQPSFMRVDDCCLWGESNTVALCGPSTKQHRSQHQICLEVTSPKTGRQTCVGGRVSGLFLWKVTDSNLRHVTIVPKTFRHIFISRDKLLFMYSYRYVCSVLYILFSSCQLAFSDYPDWGFSMLFPQL
jgi:hypothetical protein